MAHAKKVQVNFYTVVLGGEFSRERRLNSVILQKPNLPFKPMHKKLQLIYVILQESSNEVPLKYIACVINPPLTGVCAVRNNVDWGGAFFAPPPTANSQTFRPIFKNNKLIEWSHRDELETCKKKSEVKIRGQVKWRSKIKMGLSAVSN